MTSLRTTSIGPGPDQIQVWRLCKSKPSMELFEKLGTEVAPTHLSSMRNTRPRWRRTSVAPREQPFRRLPQVSLVQWPPETLTSVLTDGTNAMLHHKERTGRLGFYGYDLQDQCGSANSFSYRSDEGLPFELRGPNYPNYAMNVGHLMWLRRYRCCRSRGQRRRVRMQPADQGRLRGQEPTVRLREHHEGDRPRCAQGVRPCG